jgi:hypothetical protein
VRSAEICLTINQFAAITAFCCTARTVPSTGSRDTIQFAQKYLHKKWTKYVMLATQIHLGKQASLWLRPSKHNNHSSRHHNCRPY